jgi:predicted site-specific integrase-resolvase
MTHNIEAGDSPLQPGGRLLTQGETAERLRRSRQTVWRLGRDGLLPVVRLTPGGRPGYLEADVERLIRDHRRTRPQR